MCQQVVQFCSGSTKPLLFAGGLLLALLAVAIGYTGCTSHALYSDIDPQAAAQHSLSYYLQLAAAGYLVLVTLFNCYAAYYDQKHAIRVLAFISALNFVLATLAILMVHSSSQVDPISETILVNAKSKYDFTDKGPAVASEAALSSQLERQDSSGQIMNLTAGRMRRWTAEGADAELSKEAATRIWDRLQARGCCGLNNATVDWPSKLPKSCCESPILQNEVKYCKEVDARHQLGCLTLFHSTSLNLLIVLSLIALVNLYLAVISSIGAYRTLHYDEASQSAYT